MCISHSEAAVYKCMDFFHLIMHVNCSLRFLILYVSRISLSNVHSQGPFVLYCLKLWTLAVYSQVFDVCMYVPVCVW